MKTYRVASAADVPEDGCLLVTVNNIEIGIYRIDGGLYAWRNVCPHMAAPVCRGRVTGTTLTSNVYEYAYGRAGEILQCPWHGWEYDLRTGEHLAAGSRARLRGYPVVVDGLDLYVQMRT